MKKNVSLILVFIMLFSLCSCVGGIGNEDTTAPDSVFDATEDDGYIPGNDAFDSTEPITDNNGETVSTSKRPSSTVTTTKNNNNSNKTTNAEPTTESALTKRENDNKTLKIISYNVAGPWGSFNDKNHYSTRSIYFTQQIKDYYPDSFGTQEMNAYWIGVISVSLPAYGYYSVKRGGDSGEIKSETNAIFYLKNKYELVKSGTFWLSDTPDKMSKYDDTASYRICSYVILKNKATGYQYIHMNTHLDNESSSAREKGAQVIIEKLNAIKAEYGNLPVIITGDLNCSIDSTPYNTIISDGLSDSRKLSSKTSYESTFNDWDITAKGNEPIDHIFVSAENFTVNSFSLLEKSRSGYMVSDHYGIIVDMNIK